MKIDTTHDRRRHPRRPKLMRVWLLWQRSEEKAFITDVSLNGMFVRTTVVPPQGSRIHLLIPNTGPSDEAVRIEANVVRIVRRGDPANPLGGIGVAMERILSPRGTAPIIAFLDALLGDQAPELPHRSAPTVVEMPSGQIRSMPDEKDGEDAGIEEYGFTPASVTTDMAVFCRWKNMVIQAKLTHLGTHQSILGGLKVIPQVGDEVSVRMISSNQTLFQGLEFTGCVDQIYKGDDGEITVSLAIDPMDLQKERGGLRTLLTQIQEAKKK
jgi:hypothetical protein